MSMRKSDYPQIANTLGTTIRKKRMDLKLNLADIAKKVGVTVSYLSRIEADLQIPKPDTAESIAIALGEDKSIYVPFLLKKYFSKDSPIHDIYNIINQTKLEKIDADKHFISMKNTFLNAPIDIEIKKTLLKEVTEN
jgi:transcriptional regulator with XRE-family HTH domain